MAGIELGVRPIGEEPVHGDQDEMREELLFDAALGSGVKVLDDKDVLAHLVKLLDAPAAVVDIHELLERITLVGSDQGVPKQNVLPAISYLSSRIFSGTISRSGYCERMSARVRGEGSMVTSMSVCGLEKNSWMTVELLSCRRKMAWMPVW